MGIEPIIYDRDYTYCSISTDAVDGHSHSVWSARVVRSEVISIRELFERVIESTLAVHLYNLADHALSMKDYIYLSICSNGKSEKIHEIYHRKNKYRLQHNKIYTQKADRQIFFNPYLEQYQDNMGNSSELGFFHSAAGAKRAIETLVQCSDCKNCMNITYEKNLTGNVGFPRRS